MELLGRRQAVRSHSTWAPGVRKEQFGVPADLLESRVRLKLSGTTDAPLGTEEVLVLASLGHTEVLSLGYHRCWISRKS